MPDLLDRLRARPAPTGPHAEAWGRADVRFASSNEGLEARHAAAVAELFTCIRAIAGGPPILQEGGNYPGCWLESTGTINAEHLSRFLPGIAADTFASFARLQREDGLFPYKITADGPSFRQIQTVTPLARSVWHLYGLTGDRDWLARLYKAMAANDAWLARTRDTRGTGGVEAFCTFDTGHDESARFWHLPDGCRDFDSSRYDVDNPRLPLVAPDLTANVACQRRYLAQMAAELGEDPGPWEEKAEASEAALWRECWDEADGLFYDRDATGAHLKVQGDVLLRVLACEIGDDTVFEAAARRYLLNTRKFFARYPFTSIALDDPRFDPDFARNSWCGPSNFLTLIRAHHAFEAHGAHVELGFAMQPILGAMATWDRFPQTLSPFSGEPGFTDSYSPSILALLDFTERLCGILPRPGGELWFSTAAPAQLLHHAPEAATAYGRSHAGARFELVVEGGEGRAFRDGAPLFTLPAGVRAVTDASGALTALVGLAAGGREGEVVTPDGALPFRIGPNEVLSLGTGGFERSRAPSLIPPQSS
ncbi:MGH1-like glycoside hydrolase domain-containing protein [Pseudoroseicyclus tamaricis]|uniref:Mannosylglycerate hydrolase MGH1-like glycoside hydrolase domain-containing protein n=1 Tax=Pseudoroseicyclus tamaricis TaxID=2705421 RepID=A0A6B2JU95_9RHOB|nr:hypothetical protein [Pseudoroseicyclus tamaricis]NDV00179.1 hypothetical protein [Pseudoroseicyclus tamaricis]